MLNRINIDVTTTPDTHTHTHARTHPPNKNALGNLPP